MFDEKGYAREDGYKGAPAKASGLGVVLIFAFMLARPWLTQRGYLAWASTENGADQILLDDPEVGPQLRFIEQRFPQDYKAIRDAVRAESAKGDITRVRQTFATQMDGFYRRHAVDFAQAPDSNFRAVIEAHFQLSDAIHWRQTTCARFFTGAMTTAELVMPEKRSWRTTSPWPG